MRGFSLLLLLALLAALGFLAYENNYSTTVRAMNWRWDLPLPVIVGATYVLGMLTGWSMVAWMRRSWTRVTETQRV